MEYEQKIKQLQKPLPLGDPSWSHLTQNVIPRGFLSMGMAHPEVGHDWSVST